MQAATLEKLIERLTFEEYIDMRFQIHFMTTYRAFLTPLQLLDRLRDRFERRDEAEPPKRRQVRQLRVLAVVSRWVQHYSEPWVESDELRRALGAFLEQVQAPYPQLARQISENLHRAQEAAALQRAALVIATEPPPAAPFALDDGNVLEAAQQLTLYGALLFAAIRGSELLGLAWSKKGKEERAANLLRYIANFNRVSGWVVHAVCTTISLKQRAAVLARVIALAVRCRELNNFHHAMSVFAALVSAPVRRLKATWAELPAAAQEAFKALEALFSHSSSYKTYREALREAALPCVPYLGLALTDLTFIEEGNPEKIKNLLNFQRQMLVCKVLEGVYRLQSVQPRYSRNPAVMHWIQNLKTLSGDEEAYQMSLKIEPRNTVEGIEQMLMEEERLRARLQTAEVRNAELEAEVARLKAHIAKLDADLRAALKTDAADLSTLSRSSAGTSAADLRPPPKWAPVALPPAPDAPPAAATLRVSGREPGPSLMLGMRLPPPPAAGRTSPTHASHAGIAAAALPSPPSSPGRPASVPSAAPTAASAPIPAPALSPRAGPRVVAGSPAAAAAASLSTSPSPSPVSPRADSARATAGAGDWSRTRPSPRSLSPRPGPPPDAPPPGDAGGEGGGSELVRTDSSPARSASAKRVLLTNAAVLALPAPPAPPPTRDAVVLPPENR